MTEPERTKPDVGETPRTDAYLNQLLGPGVYVGNLADFARQLERELSQARAALGKLQQFKTFVHERLDRAGVPADPPGEHRDAGCRIGQRLDWLLDKHA